VLKQIFQQNFKIHTAYLSEVLFEKNVKASLLALLFECILTYLSLVFVEKKKTINDLHTLIDLILLYFDRYVSVEIHDVINL